MNGSPAPASQKLGAKLGRSDDLQAGPGDQPRGALVKWPATTAALRSQAELNSGGAGEPFEEFRIAEFGLRI
jgi:hypothetical protein